MTINLAKGITANGTGVDGVKWNILGQIYYPKAVCESSFAFETNSAPGQFVPVHIHPTQDEFVYMLEGRMDALIDGKEFAATAGDLIRLPMGIPHGLFNKTDQTLKCMFWVTPTRKLYDLFWAIHSMKEQNPPDVVALSARHEVNFLPPPPGT
jgi:oxalate decarboxylase/phosphoglucose isomerase-like protein (cupin superfamily)